MEGLDILNDWKHRDCAIATMHGKETIISPLFKQELGIHTVVPKSFNTDAFGTFTRDIRRIGNQLEAVRAKALAALKHTGLDLAIASEGSFGAHPVLPFVSSNLELVLFLDTKNTIEIVGHYRTSAVRARGQKIYTPEEAVLVAESWGFPDQGIILRTSEKSSRNIYKDITSKEDLKERAKKLLSPWYVRSIFIETDMRAHRCPTRMESIRNATLDLIQNCRSTCPKCSAPGFVITETIQGLPCGECGLETDTIKEVVRSCKKCLYKESNPIGDKVAAKPEECQWCNP
jgi:hypothetical protein